MSNQLNTEVYAIPLNAQYVIYAPLRKVALIGNAALVNFINRLGQKPEVVLDEEKDFLNFLANVRLVGEEGDAAIATRGNAAYKPAYVTLFLTTRCNLRCVYCYASAGAHQHHDMTLATARQGIEFVCQNARATGRRDFGVGYHGGGEPTANWKVLVDSLAYANQLARQYKMEVRASIATNGVFSEAKCQWIIENIQEVTLSVDGLPEVHDAQRPLSSGGASANAVLKTIDRFDKAKFPYCMRMTATALSTGRLAESLRYLLSRTHPRQIQVEPVYDLGRGQNPSLQVDPQSFVAAFREARSVAEEHSVELFYSAARLNVISNRFCQSCGDGFSLTPSGSVSACYEVCDEDMNLAGDFIFGNYDADSKRYLFDHEKLQNLRERSVEVIPWCQGCFCKWHCAGDCAHKAQYATRNGQFIGHMRCEITRALILDQILEKITKHGGVFWAENKAA